MNVLTRGENVELEPKDFFHSSTELVHRDLNFYKDCEAVTVNILVGLGPSVVNVPAPSIVNWLIQFRPSRSDLPRLKQPFGILIKGEPDKTMPELVRLVRQHHPSRITAVGDVVSREALKASIPVDLSIIDHKTMRKRASTITLKDRKIYYVRNPAGVITLESWDAIKKAMKERNTVILVDGEEDLLALPCTKESPDGAMVLYGQPDVGLVAIDITPKVRHEVSLIIRRMTREETDQV